MFMKQNYELVKQFTWLGRACPSLWTSSAGLIVNYERPNPATFVSSLISTPANINFLIVFLINFLHAGQRTLLIDLFRLDQFYSIILIY